jgi:hypothetical protein
MNQGWEKQPKEPIFLCLACSYIYPSFNDDERMPLPERKSVQEMEQLKTMRRFTVKQEFP